MERICSGCARQPLHVHRFLRTGIATPSRNFTASSPHNADDSKPTPVNSTPAIKRQQLQRDAPLRITRHPIRSSLDTQLLRRTASPQASSPARAGAAPPQGTLLRRSGPPQQQGQGQGQILHRSGPPRQGGRPGAPGQQNAQGKPRRRRTAESVKAREAEEEAPSDDIVDEYMNKYIDRPDNPTEPIDYNPKAQELVELQKDWPNTPLSATGLSASLVQKIEWLARRIPHGYQTPEQLAERFVKGNLTRFESEEEKQQVLKVASELAKKRADTLAERKGSEVAAEDMSLSDLSARDEKQKLVAEVIKGEVGEMERQRMPFLDSVMRNLRNNETYHKHEMDKFMATVQKLMPQQGQRRQPQAAQRRA